MSDITTMIPHVIVISIVIPTIIGVIRLVLGPGLGFRIYAMVMPLVGLTAVASMTSDRVVFGSAAHIGIILPIMSVIVGTLAYLYRVTVIPLRLASENLGSASAQLAATAAQSSTTAAEQSAMAAQVSTTAEEITQTSAATAESAQEILSVSDNAVEHAQQGEMSVQEAAEILAKIGQVGSIVDTVRELAEQSNLLALNASIEAAKAGEHGRGFAVVAAEVRNLAEQSSEATRKIRAALELSDEGRSAIVTATDVIRRLMGVLEDSSDRSRQIAAAAKQQTTGIEQINEAAGSLSAASQDTAAATRQIEESSSTIEDIGHRLQAFVGGKQNGQPARGPAA